jgi:multiple sugar transport system ATP-binding protein
VGKLELRAVRKSFQAAEVIHGIDLVVDDGSFTVLVGPSGCGKSTLLRMIAGLEEVTSGEIRLDGERCDHLMPSARGMAMVFQSYALYPHMSVRENLRFGLVCQKLPKPEIEARIRRAADILQIAQLLERKPSQLSGGQSQRVAIGRAIVKEPKAFLFDEPLSNLDAELRVRMRSEIVSLHRRLRSTIVYVTHDQVEAMTMADKIVVLRDGVTEQIGTPIELYARPTNRFVAGFLGAPQMNMLSGLVTAVDSSGVEVALDNERSATRASVAGSDALVGQRCTVGIRPEHLAPSDAGQILARVDATEMLGADTIVYATLESGERVTASLRGIHRIYDASMIGYSFDRRFVHVFDQTGGALDPLRSWKDDYLTVAGPAEASRSGATLPSANRKTVLRNPISV